jgi:hypothetical protein
MILLALLYADAAPDPSPKLLKILETSERMRVEQIHQLRTKYIKESQQVLAATKRGKIDPHAKGTIDHDHGKNWTFTDQASKRRSIEESEAYVERLKQRLVELEKRTDVLFEALSGDDLQRGSLGQIGACPVLRVVDKQSALIKFQWTARIARNNAPAYESREIIVLLRGVDTSGMADGQPMDSAQVIEVVGNQSFETDTDKKTVFVFESFDQTQLDPWRNELAKFAPKPLKATKSR